MSSRPLESVLSRHWRALSSVALFSLFFNALMLILPIYMLSIFSHVLTSKNADTLWLLTLVAALALGLQAVVDAIRSRLLVRVGLSVESSLGPKVVQSLVERHRGPGPSDPRILSDAGELRRFVSDTHLLALIDFPFVPLYVLVITWLHPLLGALALSGALLHLLVAAAGDAMVKRPMSEASEAREKGRLLTDELIRHGDLVRSMGMMSSLLPRLRQLGSNSLLWFERSADLASGFRSMVRATRVGLQIALYCAGAWLFLNDQIMVGAIVAASVLLARVMAPIDSAIPAWRSARRAREAMRRLDAALVEPVAEPVLERVADEPNPPRFEARRATVRVSETGKTVLNRITLAAQPGELLGIVGASGSGKSALGRLIAGAWQPTGGTLLMNGRQAADWFNVNRAAMVGYCPQEPQVFSGSIDENIARFNLNDGWREPVRRAARSVGLDGWVSALPDAYASRIGSGATVLPAGVRQQLSLARAFYGDPDLLVLDEPAAWLDHSAQQALMGAIEAARARGATVVLITHQPALLRNANRIVVMNGGAVELSGPADKVLAHLAGKRGGAPNPTSAPNRLATSPNPAAPVGAVGVNPVTAVATGALS
jgi:PrtD family type I secretion system ABC transporter